MIEPLVSEAHWEQVWANAKPWLLPQTRLVVISPHPDDETLGCGGLISAHRQNGGAVEVVAVTDGERAYGPAEDLAQTRRDEQQRALTALGVDQDNVTRLGLPDSGVGALEPQLLELMLPHCTEGTHLLAPWIGDFHPDHEACGRTAKQAAQRAGVKLTFYFFWMWHRGTPSLLNNLPLRSFPLTAAQRTSKLVDLAQYRSQLEHPSGEPVLPENLLWPAKRWAEVFLTT